MRDKDKQMVKNNIIRQIFNDKVYIIYSRNPIRNFCDIQSYYFIPEEYYTFEHNVKHGIYGLILFTEKIINDNILDIEQIVNIIFYMVTH